MSNDKRIKLQKLKNSPPTNYNSTLSVCPGTHTMVLFGGFDDFDCLDSNVYLLDTITMEWSVDTSHKGLYREGHSASYIGNGNILVFGGLTTDDESSYSSGRTRRNGRVNEEDALRKTSLMLIYNIFTRTWTMPPDFVLANAPASRSRHACCLSPDGKKLYLSGGVVNSNTLDDLYSYDFTTGTWEGPFTFVHRFDHSITIHKNKIYSFGGLDKDMNHVRHQITYFDLKDHTVGEISIFTNRVSSLNAKDDRYMSISMNGPIKLNVSFGRDTLDSENNSCHISYFDLNSLKHVNLFELNDLEGNVDASVHGPLCGNSWRSAVISEDGSLLIWGSPLKDEDQEDQQELEEQPIEDPQVDQSVDANGSVDEPMTSNDTTLTKDGFTMVLSIPLSELGIEYSNSFKPKSGVSDSFKELLQSEELTDFEIYCFKDTKLRHLYVENSYFDFKPDDPDTQNLQVVKVHKLVLFARWPYFKRLIESGMNESKYNRMFIPEPVVWVRGLIHYLYADDLSFQSPFIPSFSVVDYSGLLILSNFYELMDLRVQILNKLYEALTSFIHDTVLDSEQDIETMLQLWCNVYMSNEPILIERLTYVLKQNWGYIVSSVPFANLSKEAILKLIQSCTVDGSDSIVTPKKKSSVQNLVLGSSESSSVLSSPNRDCNSPFLQSSKQEHTEKSDDTISRLPVLQHLSANLQDCVNQY